MEQLIKTNVIDLRSGRSRVCVVSFWKQQLFFSHCSTFLAWISIEVYPIKMTLSSQIGGKPRDRLRAGPGCTCNSLCYSYS